MGIGLGMGLGVGAGSASGRGCAGKREADAKGAKAMHRCSLLLPLG